LSNSTRRRSGIRGWQHRWEGKRPRFGVRRRFGRGFRTSSTPSRTFTSRCRRCGTSMIESLRSAGCARAWHGKWCRDRVALGLPGRVPEWQGNLGPGLPRSQGGPRSRRAARVGQKPSDRRGLDGGFGAFFSGISSASMPVTARVTVWWNPLSARQLRRIFKITPGSAKKESTMAWHLEGSAFETCPCDVVCPCVTSAFTGPADVSVAIWS
jgi:hypothetical protein